MAITTTTAAATATSTSSYEHIERWNPICLDPNRSFGSDPATHTEESSAVIALLASLGVEGSSEEGANPGWVCHVDCHETTDTDESEFMPARAALGGSVYKPCDIPDGFYLVGDSDKPQLEWHKAVIDAVREVTHIAPGDDNGTIIEEPLVQDGVIVVPATQVCVHIDLLLLKSVPMIPTAKK